jgi:hypothetical protein
MVSRFIGFRPAPLAILAARVSSPPRVPGAPIRAIALLS